MVKMYIPRQASPRHVAPATAPATNVAIIVFSSFVLLFVLFVFVCFPCCDYIIPCKCGLFNEQIRRIMLVKQQKCDTVLHKQHQAAKLAQNKNVLTHSQTPPVDIFLNLL